MRILILGASGMLGHKLWQLLPQRFPETFATIRSRRGIIGACGLFDDERVLEGIDALDFAAVGAAIDRLRPQIIVNCIAVTKRRDASTDALASIALNALLPHRLGQWSAARGSRVIHFSTDCVFSGRTGRYSEASLTDADDLYGRTKALGEIAGPGLLTLRSSFIGRELAHGAELLEWVLAQRGRRINGYRRAFFTGVSTLFMARLVGDIIAHHPQLSGLYNIASEVITKFDLLCLARDAFGLDVQIEPDDGFVCRRDLDGEKLRKTTGIIVPPWRAAMAELAADPTPYDRWRTQHAVR